MEEEHGKKSSPSTNSVLCICINYLCFTRIRNARYLQHSFPVSALSVSALSVTHQKSLIETLYRERGSERATDSLAKYIFWIESKCMYICSFFLRLWSCWLVLLSGCCCSCHILCVWGSSVCVCVFVLFHSYIVVVSKMFGRFFCALYLLDHVTATAASAASQFTKASVFIQLRFIPMPFHLSFFFFCSFNLAVFRFFVILCLYTCTVSSFSLDFNTY